LKNIYINTIIMTGTECSSQKDFIKEAALLDLPIQGVEVRREYFPFDQKEKEEEISLILETGKRKNWQVRYSVPEPLFTPTGLNVSFGQWLEEAKRLGAESIKCNIGEVEGISKKAKAELDHYLMKYPIEVTIENDQTQKNGLLKHVLKALSLLKGHHLPIGYTFDLGNWLEVGEDPEESFRQTKSEIRALHLKNLNFEGQVVLLEQGCIPWKEYLAKEWPIVLEYPMNFEELEKEVIQVKEGKCVGKSNNDR